MASLVLHGLIARRVDELVAEMPGVRDGDVESIHRARVATRRLRELLPLAGDGDALDDAERAARETGRRLGRVRDLDVMADLLARYEEAVPSAVVAAALARRTIRTQRRDAARSLVKALDLHALVSVGRLVHPAGSWTRRLQERIAQRADEASGAVEHAGGLYFPNRLHRTRVAIKKLRYAVEIADAVFASTPRHLLADLRTIQGRLGDLHDLEVLSACLDGLAGDEAPPPQIATLRGALHAEIARLHHRYLGRRDRLKAAIEACRRVAAHPMERSRPAAAWSTITAAALPAALALAAARKTW